jgi:hypothetical protein
LSASSLAAVSELLERTMLDLIFIAAGVGFFALSIAYVYVCDRL